MDYPAFPMAESSRQHTVARSAEDNEAMHIAVHRTAGIIRTHEFGTCTRWCDAWRRWRRSTLLERYPVQQTQEAVTSPRLPASVRIAITSASSNSTDASRNG